MPASQAGRRRFESGRPLCCCLRAPAGWRRGLDAFRFTCSELSARVEVATSGLTNSLKVGVAAVIRVQSVAPDSLGGELGLVPGTELVAVNGRALEDFLDWEFLTADERFLLAARLPTGEAVEYDIERPEGLPMGVTLEPPRIRRCGNHCDFCFVDGNPDGLRTPLYIRDDDYRLSFRYGNFATLTNLKPWDMERIVEYRLSPLYVSVHATDPTIRRWLLRNPEAPDIIPQLAWFVERGIAFHAQVVLVPGVNGGPVL